MHLRLIRAATAALALSLTGCATYMDARANVALGGKLDQQKSVAARDLNAAQTEHARLQALRAQQDIQLGKLDEQVLALQRDQKVQEARLAEALRMRKITKAKHDQLSKEIQSVKADAASVQVKVNMARLQAAGDGVFESDAEFKKLRARHEELSKLLSQAMRS